MKQVIFLLWLGGFGFVFLAANIIDPYLLPLYGWAPGLLFAVGVAVFLLLTWKSRKRRLLRFLWLAVPLSVAASLSLFEFRKFRVMSDTRPIVQELGRHFIVGYRQFSDIEPLAANGLIGGVYVTRRNVVGRPPEDLQDELAHLQAIRRRNELPPLIVATDQEGGTVNHLSPPLPGQPGLSRIASFPQTQRRKVAFEQGRLQGRQLAALGINVNFAPVLDLRSPLARNPLDFHSHIAERAISDDPNIVADIAAAYAQGLAREGVAATVKHFPGLGRVHDDTHHFRAELPAPQSVLEQMDWKPFRQLLTRAGRMVMIAHVTVNMIDPDYPASQSRKLVDGILRKEWGFQGLTVSDDLTMSAVYQHGYCQGVINTLNAGVDLLLVAYDDRQFPKAMDCLLRNLDELDAKTLASSHERLDRVMAELPLPDNKAETERHNEG